MWRREGIYYQLINSIQSDHHSINSPRSTCISAFSSSYTAYLFSYHSSSFFYASFLSSAPSSSFPELLFFSHLFILPYSSTFSSFYLSVDLFIPIFRLFTPPAPLTALHPPSLSLNLQTSPPLQPHQLSLPLASIQSPVTHTYTHTHTLPTMLLLNPS